LASTLMKLGHTYHGFFEFDRAQQAYEEAFYIKSQFDDSLTGAQLPDAPHAFRTTYQTIPMTLDPTRSIEGEFVLDLFSGLVQITPTLEVIPDVAKSWKIMDGGRTYIFHLRDDVYWSDGILVTAGDFIFAWRRALDPVQGSPVANLLYDIKGAESFHHGQLENEEMLGISALNESTIRIELEEPTSYFLQLLAIFVSKPVPRHTVELYSETWAEPGNIVTNGPFFLASWQEDNSLVLERNPTYHGHFQGNLNRVELRYIHDSKGMLDLYEADELDALSIWHLAPAELGRALSYKAGEIMTLPSHTTGFLGFNTLRPPLDDPRVRRALILAKDRFSSDDTGDAERSDPPTGGFVPPTIPGHVPDIALPYDPSLARALLAEAGYPDGRGFPVLEAIVATWDQDRLPKQFKIWKSKLGVEISWKVIEWDHYMDRIQSDDGPHIYGFGWGALYPDPDSYLRVGIRQISNWRHEGYEQLVELARHKMEFSERMDLYQQAERILVDESPIMPYKYLRLNLLVKPWVKSYHPEYLWEYWKDVILEPH
jgi:oligopeptide transport system substrate-binding protein